MEAKKFTQKLKIGKQLFRKLFETILRIISSPPVGKVTSKIEFGVSKFDLLNFVRKGKT